jgi:hypothetical protein
MKRCAAGAARPSELPKRTTKPSWDVPQAQWFAVGAYHERLRNRGDARNKNGGFFLNPPSRICTARRRATQVMAIGPPGEPVAPVIGTGAKTYAN